MLIASLIARLIEQEYEALADEMLSAATPSSALAQLLSSSTPSSALDGSAYAGGANGGSGSANGGTPLPNGCNCHGTTFATPSTQTGASVATIPSASSRATIPSASSRATIPSASLLFAS